MQSAVSSFEKLNKMLPHNTEVMYQLSQCYDLMGDLPKVSACLFMSTPCTHIFSTLPEAPTWHSHLHVIILATHSACHHILHVITSGDVMPDAHMPCTHTTPWETWLVSTSQPCLKIVCLLGACLHALSLGREKRKRNNAGSVNTHYIN